MVTGILVLVPVMATANILRWLFVNSDKAITQYLPEKIGSYPGVGLLLVLVLIFLIGSLTQNFVGQWFVNVFDTGIRKLPLIGGIYSTIKKFLETIVNPGSDKFHGVVLIQFPKDGVYSIGFRTGRPDPKIIPKSLPKDKHLTNVFVPCTPNPTSGFYLLAAEEDLIPLDISVQEAFKIVISMGIVTTDAIEHFTSTIPKS